MVEHRGTFQKGLMQMKTTMACSDHRDFFEYHGNTEIERIRKKGDNIIARDWLVFDTVDEAMEYFNDKKSQLVRYSN